jgi:tRNA(Leu) C34 or U34 (ribose-2'-O)-methylase TrmL
MDEKARRRAGLDYWDLVDCVEHASWGAFLATEQPRRLWLYTTRAARPHWQADFRTGDYLLFGQENRRRPRRRCMTGWRRRTARRPASLCPWWMIPAPEA